VVEILPGVPCACPLVVKVREMFWNMFGPSPVKYFSPGITFTWVGIGINSPKMELK
jgi:hypothetical protein